MPAGNKKKEKESENSIKGLEDYSPEMQKKILREMRKRERNRKFLLGLLATAAVVCLGCFVFYYINAGKGAGRNGELSGLIGSEALSNPEGGTASYLANLSKDEKDKATPGILDKYKTLHNSNKDMIGWIKIDGTVIDYPVMQASDNEYYLNHDFDRKEKKSGALFLDCRCDAVYGNNNFIIYGHHLTSGSMFSCLSDYQSKSFYEKHPYITFDTVYATGTYQVMYAFRSRVYEETDVNFKYYDFIDADSEEEFNSYMNEMKAASFIDTGITAVYGDQLLTLSTCDYAEENGRFVVVAKKIS